MNKLYSMVFALVVVITLVWLQAEPNLFTSETFMQWRSGLIQISGIVSVLLLSLTMLLALRLPMVERLTQGLDKSYRLHRWLGIYGVAVGAIHWLLAIVPKQLILSGYLERPGRGGAVTPDSLYAVIHPLRDGAQAIGEWTLYLFVLLTLIALFAPVRYKIFKWTHKLMAAAFIAIGYHALILIKHAYWNDLITPVIMIIVFSGFVAAVMSLMGRIGRYNKHCGLVTDIKHDQDNNTTRITIDLPSWKGHQAGQFAFLKIGDEEPHPFTIASIDSKQRKVCFLVKALGDFTSDIHRQVEVGQKVVVEGPYGKFNFDDQRKQVWIAGGIGCAAFRARLEQLAQLTDHRQVVFYYCTETPSPSLIEDMESIANKANVEFHVVDNRLDPFLSIEQIQQTHPDIGQRSIWFCGPVRFKNALLAQLRAINFNTAHFHSELFNFR